MSATRWDLKLRAALAGNDGNNIWDAYKNAWNLGQTPSMDGKTFKALFYDRDRAEEAVQLLKQSTQAQQSISGGADDVAPNDLEHSNVMSVFFAAKDWEGLTSYWQDHRNRNIAASRKGSVLRGLMAGFAASRGRAEARVRARELWAYGDLIEEERAGILVGLERESALTVDFVNQLGTEAQELAYRLVTMYDIRADWMSVPCQLSTPIIGSVNTPSEVRQRIASMLHVLEIDADVRDAMLSPEEYREVFRQNFWYARDSSVILSRALREMRGSSRELDLLAEALSANGLARLHFRNERMRSILSFPLLRLLHLQLILQAPILAHALSSPEDALAPHALLYILGNGAVHYSPELRVLGDAEARWTAWWAENMGEAMSALFLEDAVRLDLSTLARIPTATDHKTADFLAATHSDEHIVFESKGSVSWEAHKKQRREALAQLGKSSDGNRPAGGHWNFGGQGRAFACCLHAAKQGAQKSSLFHVADPPFAFAELFHEGWEDAARRRHYAGVLESAQLYDMADALMHREESGADRPRNREAATFLFQRESNRQSPSFRGSYIDTGDIARRLRHPNPSAYRNVRMFVGVKDTIFRELERGRLPKARPEPTGDSDSSSEELTRIPPVGVLPANDANSAPRGVYSLLSDGAFMAVEVE